jgi:hypothetical protein
VFVWLKLEEVAELRVTAWVPMLRNLTVGAVPGYTFDGVPTMLPVLKGMVRGYATTTPPAAGPILAR